MFYTAGHAALDFMFRMKEFPPKHEGRTIDTINEVYGGGAANCAYIAAKLGEPAALISTVGKDFGSSGYKAHLEKTGVDLQFVKTIPDVTCARAYMFRNAKNELMSFFYWGASAHLKDLAVPELKLGEKDIIHLATADPTFNKKMAEKYKVSFDAGYDVCQYSKEDYEKILSNAKFFFCNEHEEKEVEKITGKHPRDLGVEVVVVTQGQNGSIIYSNNDKIEVPAFKVNATNPTGAGDSYDAAFLVAHSRGLPLEKCGKVAAFVASHVVQHPGVQTPLPLWEEVLKVIK